MTTDTKNISKSGSTLTDVPYDLAYQAHYASSFSPEKRAHDEQQGYVDQMDMAYSNFMKLVHNENEQQILDVEFVQYRVGYLRRLLAKLHADSRTMSSMITGPANFPVRSNQKKLDTAHRRLLDLIAYDKKATGAIERKLRPEKAVIVSGEADTLQRLNAKLKKLVTVQTKMKLANKIIRSGKDISQKLVDAGFTEGQVTEMLIPEQFGGVGFAAFELTNNNANIKRVKNRITAEEKRLAEESLPEAESGYNFAGGNISYDVDDNRLRIYFDAKPDEEIRTGLKKNGFRWSPKAGAWQRQLTDNAKAAAQNKFSKI